MRTVTTTTKYVYDDEGKVVERTVTEIVTETPDAPESWRPNYYEQPWWSPTAPLRITCGSQTRASGYGRVLIN